MPPRTRVPSSRASRASDPSLPNSCVAEDDPGRDLKVSRRRSKWLIGYASVMRCRPKNARREILPHRAARVGRDSRASADRVREKSHLVRRCASGTWYEPYGEVTATGSSNNPYQYTGRENDGTGLYYYRARYYSPSLKRFISEDPMGLAAGLNEYAYVGGNPVSLIDPLGLEGYGYWNTNPLPTPNIDIRPPDYYNFGFGWRDFQVSATYTKCGDVFFGWGYPLQNVDGGRFPNVNISGGWVAGSDGSRTKINDVVNGVSLSASLYDGVGGGAHWNPSNDPTTGWAFDVGLGFGGKGVTIDKNWYRGNLFDKQPCGCE